MHKEFLTYINSAMNEFYDLGSKLYEGMVDKDEKEVFDAIKQLKKMLTDIQRSYGSEDN